MTPRGTEERVVRMSDSERFGNRVYAAEAKLPARLRRRAPQTDCVAAVRAALAPHGIDYTLTWRGDKHDTGGVAYYETNAIRLGRGAPLSLAFHEAAHLIAKADRGHGQAFVDAYVGAVRAGVAAGVPGAAVLLRSLVPALRNQGFTVCYAGD